MFTEEMNVSEQAKVVVPHYTSADDANRLYGNAYGVDWEYEVGKDMAEAPAPITIGADDVHWFESAFSAWENGDFPGVLDGLTTAVNHFAGAPQP